MEVLILEGDESDEVKFEIKELQYRISDLRKAARQVFIILFRVNKVFTFYHFIGFYHLSTFQCTHIGVILITRIFFSTYNIDKTYLSIQCASYRCFISAIINQY